MRQCSVACECGRTRPRVLARMAAGKRVRFRAFFANDEFNGNGWRMTWPSIRECIHTALGGHGVLLLDCDWRGCAHVHPDEHSPNDCELDIPRQARNSVARVVDYELDNVTRTAWLILETENPEFIRMLEAGDIRYVSPGVCPITEDAVPMGPYGVLLTEHKWRFLHIAFVDTPAYGEVARVKDVGMPTVQEFTRHASRVRVAALAADSSPALRDILTWPAARRRRELHASLVALMARDFDESKVDRHPAGSPEGGRFRGKGQGGGSGGGAAQDANPLHDIRDIEPASPDAPWRVGKRLDAPGLAAVLKEYDPERYEEVDIDPDELEDIHRRYSLIYDSVSRTLEGMNFRLPGVEVTVGMHELKQEDVEGSGVFMPGWVGGGSIHIEAIRIAEGAHHWDDGGDDRKDTQKNAELRANSILKHEVAHALWHMYPDEKKTEFAEALADEFGEIPRMNPYQAGHVAEAARARDAEEEGDEEAQEQAPYLAMKALNETHSAYLQAAGADPEWYWSSDNPAFHYQDDEQIADYREEHKRVGEVYRRVFGDYRLEEGFGPDSASTAALTAAYDPNQPRDKIGRWTDGGGASGGRPGRPPSISPPRMAELGGRLRAVSSAMNVPFAELSREVNERIEAGSRGGSYVPRTRRSHDLFATREEAMAFRREMAEGDPSLDPDGPVLVVGITNHIGAHGSRRLHSAYRRAQGISRNVLAGWWVDEEGRPYTDIAVVVGDRTRAERLGRNFVQDEILEVAPDGTVESIKTLGPRGKAIRDHKAGPIASPNEPLLALMAAQREFDESKVNRDDIGRFAEKPGGGGNAGYPEEGYALPTPKPGHGMTEDDGGWTVYDIADFDDNDDVREGAEPIARIRRQVHKVRYDPTKNVWRIPGMRRSERDNPDLVDPEGEDEATVERVRTIQKAVAEVVERMPPAVRGNYDVYDGEVPGQSHDTNDFLFAAVNSSGLQYPAKGPFEGGPGGAGIYVNHAKLIREYPSSSLRRAALVGMKHEAGHMVWGQASLGKRREFVRLAVDVIEKYGPLSPYHSSFISGVLQSYEKSHPGMTISEALREHGLDGYTQELGSETHSIFLERIGADPKWYYDPGATQYKHGRFTRMEGGRLVHTSGLLEDVTEEDVRGYERAHRAMAEAYRKVFGDDMIERFEPVTAARTAVMALIAAQRPFDETKVDRHPPGSSEGGRFRARGGGGSGKRPDDLATSVKTVREDINALRESRGQGPVGTDGGFLRWNEDRLRGLLTHNYTEEWAMENMGRAKAVQDAAIEAVEALPVLAAGVRVTFDPHESDHDYMGMYERHEMDTDGRMGPLVRLNLPRILREVPTERLREATHTLVKHEVGHHLWNSASDEAKGRFAMDVARLIELRGPLTPYHSAWIAEAVNYSEDESAGELVRKAWPGGEVVPLVEETFTGILEAVGRDPGRYYSRENWSFDEEAKMKARHHGDHTYTTDPWDEGVTDADMAQMRAAHPHYVRAFRKAFGDGVLKRFGRLTAGHQAAAARRARMAGHQDQPRVPAGSSKGGQWTKGAVGDGGEAGGEDERPWPKHTGNMITRAQLLAEPPPEVRIAPPEGRPASAVVDGKITVKSVSAMVGGGLAPRNIARVVHLVNGVEGARERWDRLSDKHGTVPGGAQFGDMVGRVFASADRLAGDLDLSPREGWHPVSDGSVPRRGRLDWYEDAVHSLDQWVGGLEEAYKAKSSVIETYDHHNMGAREHAANLHVEGKIRDAKHAGEAEPWGGDRELGAAMTLALHDEALRVVRDAGVEIVAAYVDVASDFGTHWNSNVRSLNVDPAGMAALAWKHAHELHGDGMTRDQALKAARTMGNVAVKHEMAHGVWHNQPEILKREWLVRTARLGPLSPYTLGHLSHAMDVGDTIHDRNTALLYANEMQSGVVEADAMGEEAYYAERGSFRGKWSQYFTLPKDSEFGGRGEVDGEERAAMRRNYRGARRIHKEVFGPTLLESLGKVTAAQRATAAVMALLVATHK